MKFNYREWLEKIIELKDYKVEVNKLLPVLLLIIIGLQLIIILFLYELGNNLVRIKTEVNNVPLKQEANLAETRDEMLNEIKTLKENLKLIKESFTNANFAEFQSNIGPKIDTISQAAMSLQNVADRESLNNLKNKVDGMNDNFKLQLDQMAEKLKQMKVEEFKLEFNTKFDEFSKNLGKTLVQINRTVDKNNLDTIQNDLYRKIDNSMSYVTSEIQKLNEKVGDMKGAGGSAAPKKSKNSTTKKKTEEKKEDKEDEL